MNTQSTGTGPVGEQAAHQIAARLVARPALCQRVQEILDIVDRDIEKGYTADQAEARVRDLTRALAQELLQGWAAATATHATTHVLAREPATRRHAKKKSTGLPPLAPSR